MQRRNFLGSLGAAALSAAPSKLPNILFIMVDEMRWDALACAGHAFVKTPNLDRLATQGTRFSAAYTVSPVCSPARASVFTGRYAHVHGVESNAVPAHNREIFLPSILKHYGYHTAISGKLHYAPVGLDFGFDQFWSFSSEGPTPEIGYNAYLKNKYGSPNKWPIVPGTCPWPEDGLGHDVGLFKYPKEDFETHWITDRSIDYLRSRKNSVQPWFLFTSFLKPHSPSVEPQPYFGMYHPASLTVPKLPPNAKQLRAEHGVRRFIEDEQMMRTMTALYYGAITHVDDQVGRLLKELDALGMADNTIVLFTADHGNMLGDHGRWFKGVQYEGSAHVPLIWRGPKGSAENKGKVVDKVIENTDLAPTILEAAGLTVPPGIQGRSFLRLARGGDAQWKDRCYSQLWSGMVLEGRWKFIDNSMDLTGSRELYDLRDDPKEQRNLAAEAPQRDRIEHLGKLLAAWRKDRPAPVRVSGMSTPSYAHLTEQQRESARNRAPKQARKRGKR